jgi:hypothetical protein
MNSFDFHESPSVSYLNPIQGIQFDGRSYALYGKTKQMFFRFIYFVLF